MEDFQIDIMTLIKILLSCFIITFCSCVGSTLVEENQIPKNFTIKTADREWNNVQNASWNYSSGILDFKTSNNKRVVLINEKITIEEK